MQTERNKDILFCLLAFGAALAILAGSRTYQPASSYFPQLLALFVAVLAAVFGIRRWKTPQDEGTETQNDLSQLAGFAKVVVSILLYTGLLLLVGFSAATILFLVVMMVILGERSPLIVASVALGLTGLLVFLFFWFLGVSPPEALIAF